MVKYVEHEEMTIHNRMEYVIEVLTSRLNNELWSAAGDRLSREFERRVKARLEAFRTGKSIDDAMADAITPPEPDGLSDVLRQDLESILASVKDKGVPDSAPEIM